MKMHEVWYVSGDNREFIVGFPNKIDAEEERDLLEESNHRHGYYFVKEFFYEN